MRHVWECVKKPYLDKVVDRGEAYRIVDMNRKASKDLPKGWWPTSAEKVETIPGVFVCKTCGYPFQGNYPPPEDWTGLIVPDCATEVVRKIQES